MSSCFSPPTEKKCRPEPLEQFKFINFLIKDTIELSMVPVPPPDVSNAVRAQLNLLVLAHRVGKLELPKGTTHKAPDC